MTLFIAVLIIYNFNMSPFWYIFALGTWILHLLVHRNYDN